MINNIINVFLSNIIFYTGYNIFKNNLISITYAEGHFKTKQPSKFIESQALTLHFC